MNRIIRHIATMQKISPVISTSTLNEQMKIQGFAQNFRILDATWDLPSAKRHPSKEHLDTRIPGSVFFDIDECSDKSTDLPHMLPSVEQFQKYVSELGVNNSHHIVIYDNSPKFGLFSAPRLWWTFKAFGHAEVSVLDGGLPKWIKDGFPVERGKKSQELNNEGNKAAFIAKFQKEMVKNLEHIKDVIKEKNNVQIVDARPSGRFHGTSPEPRPEITSGHIPGSFNVPFMECLNENRELKSAEELQCLFKERNIDLNQDMIASCGSGVSACILALAVYVSVNKEIPIYDGSWTEWATEMPSLISKNQAS